MSTEIDDNVVAMKFDNAQFEAGVKRSLTTLDSLKRGLNFDGASKSIGTLDGQVKRFSLAGMAAGITSIAEKFSVMSIVGITALSTITERAMAFGQQLAANFTKPMRAGFEEYETGLNSVQTIMANTGLKGAKGLGTVNKTLKDLNDYSDQTIYNFAEMARNVGTFTAAGVGLKDSAKAIKGIANLAALSGSNSTQASQAMYQLSQAISSGTIRAMDWNSVVSAGMSGKVFQNSLIETARVSGVKIDEMIKKNGSFKASLEEGWLSGEIMTKTLAKFTGDLSTEQLKSQGYSKAQIKEIRELATTASDAAQKVKTFSQLMGTLAEASGSGWAQSFQLIIGDFGEAKELWSFINDNMSKMIGETADARNDQLSIWHKGGGYLDVVTSIKNAFTAFFKIVTPLKEAWKEVFPSKLGVTLLGLSASLKSFTRGLIISDESAANLKMVAKGLFTILKAGVSIISGVLGLLSSMAGFIWKLGGAVLSFIDPVISFFRAVFDGGESATNAADGVNTFFDQLKNAEANIIQPILDLLQSLKESLDSLLNGGSLAAEFRAKLEPIMTFFEGLRQMLVVNLGGTLEAIPKAIAQGWQNLVNMIAGVWAFIKGIIKAIEDMFGGLGDGISNGLKTLNLETVLNIVNGVLLGGIVIALVKFFHGLSKMSDSVAEAIDGLKDAFKEMTGVLGTMQNELRARILMEIAIAILLLAGAIYVLAQIDPARMMDSIIALGILFAELLGAMAVFSKIAGSDGVKKMPAIGLALMMLGASISMIAKAVQRLGSMDEDQLTRGLLAFTGILVGLVSAAQALKSMDKGFAAAAGSMIILAIALGMIAGVIAMLGLLSWEQLGKGFAALTAMLGLVIGSAVLLSKFAKDMALSAVGLMAMSAAIGMLIVPLVTLGLLPLNVLMQGFLAVVGLMALMVGAAVLLSKFAPQMALAAAGMMAMGVAIGLMTNAILVLGLTPMDVLVQGIAALGFVLIGLVVAVNAMNGALPGAAAMLAVAGSLLILAFAVSLMASIPTDQLVIALMALIVVIGIFALAATALAPVIPAMIGLAGAIALIGLAMLAAGLGMMLFALASALLGPALQLLAQGFLAFANNLKALGNVIPLLVGLGLAIAIFGAGAIVAGVGLAILGVGLVFAAGGILALAVASIIGVTGITAFFLAMQKFIPMIGGLSALGGAMLLLGAGFLVAGAGLTVLALGLILMSVALSGLMSAAPALALIPQMVKTFTDLLTQIPAILAVAGALALLGAGALAAGIGITAMGVGSLLLAGALSLLSIGGTLLATAVAGLIASFAAAAAVGPQANTLAIAVLTLSAAFMVMAAATILVGVGLVAIGLGLAAVSVGALLAAVGVAVLIGAMAGMAGKLTKSMAGVPEAIGKASSESLNRLNEFHAGVVANMPKIIDAGTKAVTSFAKSISAQAGVDKKIVYDGGEKLGKAMNDGMVKGISNSKRVEEAARRTAKKALDAAKDELDSHSPSRETEKLGNWFVEGMAGGIEDMSYLSENAARGVAKGAMSSLKEALAKASETVMTDTDLTPTIRPVLDLSGVRKDAQLLDKAIGAPEFSVSTAYAVANDILRTKAAQEAEAATAPTTTDIRPIEVKYEQNNYSPKALSDVDIYRQTNNQISAAKGALIR